MADEALQAALGGFNVTPAETYWGVGAGALGKSLPLLIDPVYGDRGTNIGIALGGALLQGLLGYQAKKEAAEQSLEGARLANSLIALQTPEERVSLIEQSPTMFTEPLTKLSSALTLQQVAQKQRQAQALADLTTAAEFELGDLGTKVFERKLANEAMRQAAITEGFQKRQELEDELLRGRMVGRKQLGLQDVNVPNAIMNRAIERNASSDLAFDVAATIDRYRSIPEFAAAKSISAFGDDQLKSRLRNLATVVLQSRSGLAATDKERVNLDKILTGDFTAVSPDVVSGLLRRFATDEKELAASAVAAGTQRPEDFVAEVRASAQEGRKSAFGARVPQYGNLETSIPSESAETTTTQQPDKMQILQNLQAQLAELKRQKAAAGK